MTIKQDSYKKYDEYWIPVKNVNKYIRKYKIDKIFNAGKVFLRKI